MVQQRGKQPLSKFPELSTIPYSNISEGNS